MRSSHVLVRAGGLIVVGLSVVLFSVSGWADSQASVSVTDRPACLTPCQMVGDNFTFSLTPGPGAEPVGGFSFTNDTQTTWHSLHIVETGYVPSSVICMSSAFENCRVSESASKDQVAVWLSGVGGRYSGVAPGESFTINLRCPHCGPNQTIHFAASANGVAAEPKPAVLLATGMLLIGVASGIRRRDKLIRLSLAASGSSPGFGR